MNSQSIGLFRDTFARIAWTVFASLPVPLVLIYFMFQLRGIGDSHTLAWPLYQAVSVVFPEVIVALILARSFERGGLAERFFAWPRSICHSLTSNAWTLVTIVCPLLGATVFFRFWESGLYSGSLGRLTLMVSMFILGQSMWMTGTAVVKWEAGRKAGSKTIFFAGGRLFRILATGVPMTLVFLAAIGYRFAAEQLGMRMVWTLLAGASLLLMAGLAMRLIGLQRQRSLLRVHPGNTASRHLQMELEDHYAQVSRLVQVTTLGTLLLLINSVWGSVLPLGSVLDRVQLWTYASPVVEGVSGESQFITLRHLLLAGAVLTITLVASRNLPGLIHLLLPAGFPLDKGGRYAVTFVARYLLGLIGLVEAAMLLGFEWARVQWLVAGLTVGLGFGLQEVFANLVSGIIILMERPVRVGDLVSVNNVTGTVTRMALRATTIQDSDRREWIVPNKKFITDDVMNWTLSDTVSRAVFPVSVMHGSDPLQVQEILLRLARADSRIMDYPEPSVVMSRIAGQSLDFELRVFLPSRGVFTEVQNDLLMRIERELRAAGIQIELPLMDREHRRRKPGKRKRAVLPKVDGSAGKPVKASTEVAAADQNRGDDWPDDAVFGGASIEATEQFLPLRPPAREGAIPPEVVFLKKSA